MPRSHIKPEVPADTLEEVSGQDMKGVEGSHLSTAPSQLGGLGCALCSPPG